MKIRDILRTKGTDVVAVAGDRSVLQAVGLLVEHDIGSLVVTAGDAVQGIITERDVLRLTAVESTDLGTITVASVMSRDLVTAGPDDELRRVMDVMTERRVRHLPVLEQGHLVGIVSIGDLLNACRTVAEDENAQLKQYIHRGG